MTPHEIVKEHRFAVIANLAEVAEKLLLSPHAGATGKMPRTVTALQAELEAYEELVKSMTSSSSDSYAMRDLPQNERDDYYAKAKHTLGLLYQLYVEPTLPQPTSSQ